MRASAAERLKSGDDRTVAHPLTTASVEPAVLTPTLTPTGARDNAFWCAPVRTVGIQTGYFDRGRDGFEARLPLQYQPLKTASKLRAEQLRRAVCLLAEPPPQDVRISPRPDWSAGLNPPLSHADVRSSSCDSHHSPSMPSGLVAASTN